MPLPLTHDDPRCIGPYTLVARLGSGGMGTVYLACSSGGRTAALKTVHARFAEQPEFRSRFRLEVDAARVIGGRHGARVFDADPLAPTPWLATEYVLGPALDEAVEGYGALPEHAVRALGAALCEALAQLHSSEVVHRDLKPSNILLSAHGPKVIDFGIARAVGDDRLTRTGAAAGTPAFMSPEQAGGVEHTAAGDVFALAGVLVFAATGRGPFGGGQPADLLYRVRYAEPELSAVPERLRATLARCLAKDPARRPGTTELAAELHDGAGHFADRLPDAVLADIARRVADVWQAPPARLPAPAADPTATAPDAPAARGIPRRKLVIAGGGTVLAAGAALGGWAWLRPRVSSPASGGSPETPARRPGTPPRLSWKVTPGDFWDAVTVLVAGDHAGIVSPAGLLCVDARTGDASRPNTQVTQKELVVSDGRRLLAAEPGIGSLRISPIHLRTGNFGTPLAELPTTDSLRLLAADEESLYLQGHTKKGWLRTAVDTRTGEVRWRRPIATPSGDALVARLAGDTLVIASGERFTAIDTGNGTARWTTVLTKGQGIDPLGVARLAVSGEHLFLGSSDLLALRLSDGEEAWRFGQGRKFATKFPPEAHRYGPPVVRDDVVYAAERGHGLVALDAKGGDLLWEQRKALGPPVFWAAGPDIGKRYIYVKPDVDQWVTAIDLRTHRVAWTFSGAAGVTPGLSTVVTAHRSAGRVLVASGGTVCAIPLE
ncbi:PQQ-binding-like beta-propeller repeat protein [Streptomyces sp. XD-27]|uniref:protein kinase domain-containing protein n=1 Tax=Streptomyces sp. XD-27 TaxID=3062779 RepID=UPI0026F467E4|nr:PQQ-binding-like beta-propeller repeat protein [Streptomyces sp. XD-27]WKX72921.1 protein kinase [Streptomyces sp. XD-27]